MSAIHTSDTRNLVIERGLAHFQGITLHVVAIQLDQVEGVEDLSSSRFRVDANSERASYFLAKSVGNRRSWP